MYLDQYTVYLQNVLCNALNLRGIAIARLVLNMFSKRFDFEKLLRKMATHCYKIGIFLICDLKFAQ